MGNLTKKSPPFAKRRNSPESRDRSPPYIGDRSHRFEQVILGLFKLAGVSETRLPMYVNKQTLPMYGMAFTSSTVDEEHNYETFEQMGDATIGKFIVWSSYEKFPQMRGNPDAVEIVARMKINLGSKDTLSQIAENLGFWPFITASEEVRYSFKKKLLEDVFEACIGAIEYVVYYYSDSNRVHPGLGYGIVYELLLKVFEPYNLDIDYNVLVDAKNRLKGVFDQYKTLLGSDPVYESKRVNRDDSPSVFVVSVRDHSGAVLGTGSAALKKDAEKKAAEQAIAKLALKGYIKPAPRLYDTFY